MAVKPRNLRPRVLHLHRMDEKGGATLDHGARYVECLPAGLLGDVDATHIIIPAGGGTDPHRHRRATCFVFVVDGRGAAVLNRRRQRIALNDFVVIPPKVWHSFHASPDEPMTLLCLHGPAVLRRDGTDPDLEYRPRPAQART